MRALESERVEKKGKMLNLHFVLLTSAQPCSASAHFGLGMNPDPKLPAQPPDDETRPCHQMGLEHL